MFVRPEMGYVRAKIGFTGQFDQSQPGNYLQPWVCFWASFQFGQLLFCGLKLKPIPQIVHHCLLVCWNNYDLRFLSQGFPSLLSVLAISVFWYTYISEKVENEIKAKKSTLTKYDINRKGCNSFRLIIWLSRHIMIVIIMLVRMMTTVTLATRIIMMIFFSRCSPWGTNATNSRN